MSEGQLPDIRLRVDATLAFDTRQGMPTTIELYDPLGRFSIVSLTALFDSGIRAYFSEELERVPRDPSSDPFQEYYVEDPDIWRAGKQFVPFGSGNLIRENVVAARGDFALWEGVDVAAAAFDGGTGAQQGVTARFGGEFGLTVMAGHHFGISPTSLDIIRNPAATPGIGHGWKEALDLDGVKRRGKFTTRAEFLLLSGGETPTDTDLYLFDVSSTMQMDLHHSLTLGYSRDFGGAEDYYRLTGDFRLDKNFSLIPLLRLRDGRFADASLALRVRI
jgi:hypothetical protein